MSTPPSRPCKPTKSVSWSPSLLFKTPEPTTSLTSCDIDYDSLDAEDPHVDISWWRSFPLFGFSPRDPADPRYRALAKFKSLTAQHGIADLRWPDYLLAISVYSWMVDHAAKRALRSKSPRPNPILRSLRSSTPVTSPPSSTASFSAASSLALPTLSIPAIRDRRRVYSLSSVHTLPPSSPPSWSPESTPPTTPPNSPRRRLSNDQLPYFVFSPSRSELAYDSAVRQSRRTSPTEPVRRIKTRLLPKGDPNRRWSLPDDVRPRPRDPFADARLSAAQVHLLYHMLRHAESIYGLPLTIASAPRISMTRLTDRAIICRRTGIRSKDLHVAQFVTQPFLPAFYVAVDRSVDAIVVCIRGTANMVDSLTDVAATQDPLRVRRLHTDFSSPITSSSGLSSSMSPGTSLDGLSFVSGFGHAGVMRSARNLFSRIRSDVIALAGSYPGFTVVLTGHSLGGAAAAVLALLMRDDAECPTAVTVAFGPLPCVTYDIAEQTASQGVTVVNGPDIIPRLSVAVMLPLFATARYVADLSSRRKHLLRLGFRRGVLDWEELERETAKRSVDMEHLHDGRRLFIPGRVVQLVRQENSTRRREVEVVRVSRAKFLHVRGRERGMFLSHGPFSYRARLAAALKGLGESVVPVEEANTLRARVVDGRAFSAVWAEFGERKSEMLEAADGGLLDRVTDRLGRSPMQ